METTIIERNLSIKNLSVIKLQVKLRCIARPPSLYNNDPHTMDLHRTLSKDENEMGLGGATLSQSYPVYSK